MPSEYFFKSSVFLSKLRFLCISIFLKIGIVASYDSECDLCHMTTTVMGYFFFLMCNFEYEVHVEFINRSFFASLISCIFFRIF